MGPKNQNPLKEYIEYLYVTGQLEKNEEKEEDSDEE